MMRNPINVITKKYRTSARVVDGKLILSLPGAVTPVVWQMDLGEAKASAMEVREDKDDKHYILTLKTPRGEALNIAPFAERSDAVEALMAAARALENAQGRIRPLSSQDNSSGVPVPAEQKKSGKKWAGAVLGIVFIIILMTLWSSLLPRPPAGTDATAIQRAGSQGTTGVPLSADDFLRGR